MTLRLDGLRLQLLGLFVLPVAMLVLAVAILSTGIHRTAMRDLVASRDQRAAASAAAALDEALRARLALADLLVAHLASGQLEEIDLKSSESFSRAFPLGAAVYGANGRLLAATGSLGPGQPVDPTDPPVGLEAVQLSSADGQRILIFSGREEPFLVVGAIPLADLVRSVVPSSAGPQDHASTYLVAPGAELLLSIGEPPLSDLDQHPGVLAVLRGERGSSFLALDEEEYVVAFAPVPTTGWGLVIEEPWHSVSSSVLNLSLMAPLTLAPVLMLMILALWFGARQVIEPLRQLEHAAAQLPGGDPDAIGKTEGGIAEIQELRSTLVRMSHRIREAQVALRGYIGAITAAQEEERRRVALELHDESIQHWIALDHRLQLAAARLKPENDLDAQLLSEFRSEVQQGITELRRLSRGLRPLYLEDLGLSPAVEMLSKEAQESLGATVHFHVVGEPRRLPPEVELAVYRTVQEGLSNIMRHAEASSVWIEFEYLADGLRVAIRDDGRGFDPPQRIEDLASAGHFGLMGMLERAQSINGQIDIHSKPSQGTELRLLLPYP